MRRFGPPAPQSNRTPETAAALPRLKTQRSPRCAPRRDTPDASGADTPDSGRAPRAARGIAPLHQTTNRETGSATRPIRDDRNTGRRPYGGSPAPSSHNALAHPGTGRDPHPAAAPAPPAAADSVPLPAPRAANT